MVNSELVTMSPPSSASSLYASSLNSLGSRSRGGLEAMESSLVEEMEGREQGPADTCPESLELGADTGTVFTLSRMAGAGAGPGEDALSWKQKMCFIYFYFPLNENLDDTKIFKSRLRFQESGFLAK